MRRSALQPGQHALVSGRERRSPPALAAGGRSGPGERRDLGFPRARALWRAAEGKEEERYRRGTSARGVRQSRALGRLLGDTHRYSPIWVLISCLTWSLTSRIQASSRRMMSTSVSAIPMIMNSGDFFIVP